MNLADRTFTTPRLLSDPQTPGSNKQSTINENTPRQQETGSSWSARMVSKMRQCRDVIKQMMKLTKTPNAVEQTEGRANVQLFPTPQRMTTSTPDIITCNRISMNRSREEPIVRYSKVNSDVDSPPKHRLCVSIGGSYAVNTSDCLTDINQERMNDSLQTFLILEKEIEADIARMKEQNSPEHSSIKENTGKNSLDKKLEKNSPEISLTKRKISAEPFFSSRKCKDLFWEEDSDESLPEVWNHLDLDSSEIIFNDASCRNSTFHEEMETGKPKRNCCPEDSGFENNTQSLHEAAQ